MNEDEIGEVAARWHSAQETEDMDWPRFTAWLEADPRHRPAFDQIALIDEAVDRHRDTLRRLSPPEPPIQRVSRRWRWATGGVAAAAVAATVAFVLLPDRPVPRTPTVATEWQAGASVRKVRIAGSQVTLAPGSRLSAANGDPSRLALNGRATFDVRHDPSRTLVVQAAGFEIRDVGTRFEVIAGADMVQVTVAEGEVAVRAENRSALPVRIVAGRTATGTPGGGIVTAAAPGAPLAAWRTGPLTYDAAPLGLVAADLSRATGRRVLADASVATRPFSGVLATGDAEAMTKTVATLTGLEARRQGETIRLGDRTRR